MSFFGTLQQFAATMKGAPSFVGGPNVGVFRQAIGATLDLSIDELQQGLRFMHPLRCDVSALPVLAKDRSMSLYPTEGVASQRYRLSQWKQLHRQRGTHQGEMRHVAPYFLSSPVIPTMRIVHQSGSGARATWHTLAGSDGIAGAVTGAFTMTAKSPSNWNWDGVGTARSRFWLVLYTSGLTATGATWDDGATWDTSGPWDGALTSDQILDIAAMVVDWKAAHSRLAGIILASDPASFDPGDAITVNGDGTSNLPDGKWNVAVDSMTGQPTRLSTATLAYSAG